MRTRWTCGVALVAALGLGQGLAFGQIVERDTKITGPRGRSIMSYM